jgi:hypothetical protein
MEADYAAALRKYDDRAMPGSYATDLYEQAGYGIHVLQDAVRRGSVATLAKQGKPSNEPMPC